MSRLGSWKTTAFGVVSAMIALLSAIQLVIDGDPNTNPDWGTLFAAIMAAGGLIFARDNSVTSKQAGAE